MPPENEYLREINDDLYYEPDRILRSAPAAVNHKKNYSDLFSSRDLVLVPRITKTAPAINSPLDDDQSFFFPEISWMVSDQNRRLSTLLDHDKIMSRSLTKSKSDADSGQMDQSKAIFNNNILQITKLIEMSKHVLRGRPDDKFSNSILALNVRDHTSKPSEGYHDSLPPTQKHDVTRGFRTRRSVREIAEQVSRKIKQLKTDPGEFKLLKEKIGRKFT
jgi:hypothetical protein